MPFDPASLFLSLIVSTVGLALFVYGKKQGRMPQLVVGALFMVYPYFVEDIRLMVAIALVLAGGLWWIIRLGW